MLRALPFFSTNAFALFCTPSYANSSQPLERRRATGALRSPRALGNSAGSFASAVPIDGAAIVSYIRGHSKQA